LSQWQPALEAFAAIGRDSAFYDDALSHIGYIYLETDRVGDAIKILEARAGEDKPRPQIFNYLASLYATDGQHDQAMATIDRGLELYPANIELLYQRGLLLERAGRHAEAMQAMQALLAIDGEHAEALNFLAYALAIENRDLDQALEYAEHAIKLNPAPHILDTLGWVYYRQGRFLEALKMIEEASRSISQDAVILEHLGDIHLALNNLAQARAAYEKALQLDPDNVDLRAKLDKLAGKH
jgi:tetratricopeptide (TPR) repeat protein